MSELMRSLFRLGRELRYQELPIIGQRVVIESLDHVDHVLRQLATPWLTRDPQWDGCEVVLGLAKHGILDRWCAVEPSRLQTSVSGVQALRINGFVDDEPASDPSEQQLREMGSAFLVEMAANLDTYLLKLFLSDGLPLSLRVEHNLERYERHLRPELLPGYFPRAFEVVDACLTNSPDIWINKHFYL